MRYLPSAQPADLAELRLLLELRAVRRLASRGLADDELRFARKLADVTLRMARSGDCAGYLRAGAAFHLYLLELTCDPALSQLAPVLAAGDGLGAETAEQAADLMARGAREHRELVPMLADGMASAADHLIRLHHARLPGRPVSAARRGDPGLTSHERAPWATG
jgi:DNA-binding GntR family transcriptional regulator